MVTRRRRVAAIVAAFALVFALGVGWLVRTVTAPGTVRTSADAGRVTPTPTSGAAGDTGSGGGSTPETPRGPGTGGSGQSGGPHGTSSGLGGGTGLGGGNGGSGAPRPAQAINVSGPLGGGPMDDSCRFFINPFEVTLTVRSVALVPADSGLQREDKHCPVSAFFSTQYDLKPCLVGASVAPGKACYAGFEIVPEKRAAPGEQLQPYSAKVRLDLAATCVSADVTPCSQADVARRAPSAGNPVPIRWTPTSASTVNVFGKRETQESAQPSPDESSAASSSPSP